VLKSSKHILLSLDAMGGDKAPHMVIEGAALALQENPNLRFLLHGDEKQIIPLLKKHPSLECAAQLLHTPDAIKSDEKPSIALRQGRNSSMRLAINAAARGNSQGVVSAGNTGAYMAMAKIFLKMIDGIDRPAIVGSFPTLRKPCIMLDLGANVACDENHLIQFAIMGKSYAQEILGVKKPSIGLLNVGEEEQKGNVAVQGAAQIFKKAKRTFNFHGFVEGDDIMKGTVDVIVTDGFTGNVALKTIEGVVHFIMTILKDVFKSSIFAKVGYLLSMHAFKKMATSINPKKHNGAMLIGLKGIAIKSHGGADAVAFASAIKTAAQFVSHDLNKKIEKNLEQLKKDLKK
jgi:glycerol-3-phosphate acyltransferase PlsX